jgi:hypothetical protein
MCRVSDSSDNVLRFFEVLARHLDDINRVLPITQCSSDPDASVTGVSWLSHGDGIVEEWPAVAESAATTRWRDEPNRANIRTGKNSV